MKKALSILAFFLLRMQVHAQQHQLDYRLYHKGIIEAEQAIFIDNNPAKGLDIFKSTFAQYDFVWVDDCVEAFQLALFFKRDDMATLFIKKALDNGFELKLLDMLSLGTPCTFYKDRDEHVTIHKSFVDKNKRLLEAYSAKVYPMYLKRINRQVFENIVKRHVEEQLYKDGHSGLESSFKVQDMIYDKVCESNLHYMDTLAQQHFFVGERLLGIYTDKLVDSLKSPYASTLTYKNYLLKHYKLPVDTKVPIQSEGGYFEIGATYNMLFHNIKSYQTLQKYSDEAIRSGYWHPREIASLKYNEHENHKAVADPLNLHLENYCAELTDTKRIDEVRSQLLLPSYEIDHAKLQFAQKNKLQLSFGFFNGTR